MPKPRRTGRDRQMMIELESGIIEDPPVEVRAAMYVKILHWRARHDATYADVDVIADTLGVNDPEAREYAASLMATRARKTGRDVICNSCRAANHDDCRNVWDFHGERRAEPTLTWCDCQHQPPLEKTSTPAPARPELRAIERDDAGDADGDADGDGGEDASEVA